KCNVSFLQSLDRMALAEQLHHRLHQQQKTMDVLLQINTSSEESKFGIAPESAIIFARQVAQLSSLKIKGLMTIGLFTDDKEKVRQCFQLLRKIKDQIQAQNIPDVIMSELSMGMSNDLETAIAEGATIIRVGTAVFGKRPTPNSYYWNESRP